jgi:hypothetical protein
VHRLEALQERLQAKLSDALLPLAATNLTWRDAGLRILQPFHTMRRIVCGTEFSDSHKTV